MLAHRDNPYLQGFFSVFKTTPVLTIDEWCDNHRWLPVEGSAEPGRWSTDRVPYLRPIMRDLSPSSATREIVICKGSQLGATEILLNAILYWIDAAPGTILAYQPTGDVAKKWEKQRVMPSILKCPVVLAKLEDNTFNMKTFKGGSMLNLSGTHTANAVASIPAKYVVMDEYERYPEVIAEEGSPGELAKKRADTFPGAKIIYASTPTVLSKSGGIWEEYLNSTQGVFHVPCPHCGVFQELVWERMRWEEGKPETVWYSCKHCEGAITERHKTEMLSKVMVHEKNPGHLRHGYHVSRLYAPVGWKGWVDAVLEYEAAKDNPEKKRSFTNLVLGLPYDDGGERVNYEELVTEDYGFDVPERVLILTLAVDVQTSPARVVYEVRGWGDGEESWGIRYGEIMGDPARIEGTPEFPSVWDAVDELRETTFTRRDGYELHIGVTCVDSGGHYTDTVYAYCKARERLRVFAIRGSQIYERAIVGQPTRNNRAKCILFNVGVSQAKSLIYERLKLKAKDDEPMPGLCHFAADPSKGYGVQYFKGLTCETKQEKYVNGHKKFLWVKPDQARNEPLDCFVYGLHALRIFQVDWKKVKARSERIKKIMEERRFAQAQETEKERAMEIIARQEAIQRQEQSGDTVKNVANFLNRIVV